MSQTILPGAHILELFGPYRGYEQKLVDVIKRIADMGVYSNLEIGSFFEASSHREIQKVLSAYHLTTTTFLTPEFKDQHLNLCDLNEENRKKAVTLGKQLMDHAAQNGCIHIGVPSGDDPGKTMRELAKTVLKDSLVELADYAKQYDMHITIEPLDRYAFKKQLIGPMEETVLWFEDLHQAAPNTFIHWDSAHETLGGIDLMKSLELCKPYLAQFHLCNCIADPNEPCFGDLHMDVPHAPDWKTDGFLTPEIGAELMKKVASYDKPEAVKQMYVAVEVLGHPGDDLWAKEESARLFLKRCYELADIPCSL